MSLVKFYRNLNVGVKLNIVIVLVLGAMLAAIMVVMGRNIGSLITRTGQYRVEDEAALLRQRFAEAGQTLAVDTNTLENTPGLVEAVGSGDATAAMTALVIGAARLNLDDVDLVDATGARIASVAETDQTNDVEQEDALLSFALLGSETTGVVIAEEEGDLELRLAAVVTLRDVTGEIVGGLLASRQVDDEFLGELNLSRDEVNAVLIYGGEILALTDPGLEELEGFSTVLLDETTLGQALDGQTVIADDFLRSAEGVPYALAHTPLTVGGDTRAAIGILVNYRELFSFQRQLTTNLIRIFAAMAVVTVGVITVFGWRSITVPLGKLQSVAQQMAAGDYLQRAETTATGEVGQLAHTFNEMADQLQQTLEGLEQRVAERTRVLEISAEVSRRLSTILDQEQLVAEVVTQVRDAFDYYHAHMYLVDEAGEYLVMVGGTGEAGQLMLSGGHKIPWGKGLVGRAAETKAVVLAPDVSQEEDWLPHPLLPGTRAEIAVPVAVGERVVGVLDVQHDVAGGLGQDDADLLSSIAGQVAIALQNTRRFAEARQKAEQEARANLIVQRIQSTNTVESALQVAVRELGKVLEAPETSVRLGAAAQPGNGHQAES